MCASLIAIVSRYWVAIRVDVGALRIANVALTTATQIMYANLPAPTSKVLVPTTTAATVTLTLTASQERAFPATAVLIATSQDSRKDSIRMTASARRTLSATLASVC